MQLVELKGVEELNKKLESVAYDVKYRGGRFALRKAAQFVRDQAKQNAEGLNDPKTGRKISDNIAERWNGRLFKRTGDLGFRVGVLQGAVLPKKGETPNESAGGPTPHWRLLEFGTEKMRAHPFMRRALESNIQRATDVFMTEYSKALDRAIKRMQK